jgi:hypothetical protein
MEPEPGEGGADSGNGNGTANRILGAAIGRF